MALTAVQTRKIHAFSGKIAVVHGGKKIVCNFHLTLAAQKR
jgi:hypothetical protein